MKKGFTLIELLVVIAIIAILAAILFPVFAQARDKARQSACLSNMKQIATAFQLYADDYDECFPVTADPDSGVVPAGWGLMTAKNDHALKVVLQPYCKNLNIFACPSASRARQYDNDYGFCSYMWNGGVMDVNNGSPTLASLKNPSSIALTMEQTGADQWNRMMPFWHGNGHWWCNYNYANALHAGKTLVNLAYADGHAKGTKFDTIETKDFGFYLPDGTSRKNTVNTSAGNPGWTMHDCVFQG